MKKSLSILAISSIILVGCGASSSSSSTNPSGGVTSFTHSLKEHENLFINGKDYLNLSQFYANSYGLVRKWNNVSFTVDSSSLKVKCDFQYLNTSTVVSGSFSPSGANAEYDLSNHSFLATLVSTEGLPDASYSHALKEGEEIMIGAVGDVNGSYNNSSLWDFHFGNGIANSYYASYQGGVNTDVYFPGFGQRNMTSCTYKKAGSFIMITCGLTSLSDDTKNHYSSQTSYDSDYYSISDEITFVFGGNVFYNMNVAD